MSDKIKGHRSASLAKVRIDFASIVEKLYQQHRFKIKPAANV
jgi:hypothetical protein